MHVGLAYCRCTTVPYVTYLATVGKCVSVLSKLASYLRSESLVMVRPTKVVSRDSLGDTDV